MINRVYFALSFVLLLCCLAIFTFLNNRFLSNVQFDMTENQVYSLTEGSVSVIKELDKPIDLYYFFSNSTTKGMSALRNYAERVERLLNTYVALSDGNIRLHIIDPEPFSEKEDKAAQLGLSAASINVKADSIYFGLAGDNGIGEHLVLPFFDPQQELFLEYEISKMIFQLAQSKKRRIAIVSDLELDGESHRLHDHSEPALTFYTQLTQLYDVIQVTSEETRLPAGIDLLVMIQAAPLSEELKLAIDAHVVATGKLIAFIDPNYKKHEGNREHAEVETSLLFEYGIYVDHQHIVFDPHWALHVLGDEQEEFKHPGFIGLQTKGINSQDIITKGLDSINIAMAGSVEKTANSHLSMEPLLSTSRSGQRIGKEEIDLVPSPTQYADLLTNETQEITVAARFSGKIHSPLGQGTANNATIIVIADTDFMSDSFWVQHSDFFGQAISTPFADNGSFILNSVDNLSGSSELINVRSRGAYTRPYSKVSELREKADSIFRLQEQQLQWELDEIENRLLSLQESPEASTAVITPEFEKAVAESVEAKVEIRKKLRQVQLQLDRDIASLGYTLKLINILLAPIFITLLVWGAFRLVRTKAPKDLILKPHR